jgi:hypothetical protein
MSRSRKKNNIYKDKGFQEYNKVFRRKTKQLIQTNINDLDKLNDLIFYKKNELTNQYDICDYIIRDWFVKPAYKNYMK